MTDKVSLQKVSQLPMPLIYLATSQDLASWYVSQLSWSLEHGERDLSISCFDPASLGFPVSKAAAAVLKAVMDFLYDHPEVNHLSILCAGEEVYRAYSLHWNMWYASHKPPHSHSDKL